MRTTNPTLNAKTFADAQSHATGERMTLQGTVNKTAILLSLLLMASAWVWGRAFAMQALPPLVGLGLIGGFIVAMVTVFKKEWAPVTAPVYAVLEGLVLGGLSAIFELRYPGIAVQAVALTFGTLAAMLLAYSSGLIPPSQNLRLGIVAATGAICLFYIASMVLQWFHIGLPLIHETGPLGIGLSVFIVIIAALNLVLDFDFIEQGSSVGAPKYMEWYAAFGLLVTLVWLYLEILRLLSRVRGRK